MKFIQNYIQELSAIFSLLTSEDIGDVIFLFFHAYMYVVLIDG